jgi:hypothetical protein
MCLNEFSKAHEDAEHAITINPTFAKGYFRVAISMLELNQTENFRDLALAAALKGVE